MKGSLHTCEVHLGSLYRPTSLLKVQGSPVKKLLPDVEKNGVGIRLAELADGKLIA